MYQSTRHRFTHSFPYDIIYIHAYRLVYPELHTEVLSALDIEANVYTWSHQNTGQAMIQVREQK